MTSKQMSASTTVPHVNLLTNKTPVSNRWLPFTILSCVSVLCNFRSYQHRLYLPSPPPLCRAA